MKEDRNMGLKYKTLLSGWISIASKVYRQEKNLSCRFEDWLYNECKIKIQTSYNYRNLHKLMSIAAKLMNCRVNTTYFVKHHEILLNYFEKNEEQIPWKHEFSCTCKNCISYFFGE